MTTVNANVLKQRQAYPLDLKVQMSLTRIRHWYDCYGGAVYVAFSGGKDSTALLHLVRSLFPEVPAVFVDTGLEYPEIKDFVRDTENVTTLRPAMTFRKVLVKHGWPPVGLARLALVSTSTTTRPVRMRQRRSHRRTAASDA
jgi:3'-phosphoadenosine 5'-phosphosulfate sulfotransferase (PAPS reductase)/FAD synthetase